jgi:hypothetical protein
MAVPAAAPATKASVSPIWLVPRPEGLAGASGGASFLRKYDGSGNEAWTRLFGSTAATTAVVADHAGGIYVGNNASVIKYGSDGAPLWTRLIAATGAIAASLAVDASGNITAAGTVQGALPGQTAAGKGDAFVRRYDSEGNELSTQQYGGPDDDYVQAAGLDATGNVFVAGYTMGALPGWTSLGGNDAFVIKFVAP